VKRLSYQNVQSACKIHETNAEEILRNVFFELLCAQCLGTSFLTERPLDIDVLSRLSEDSTLARRNQIVQKHLTTLVPFLASVRIQDLLDLRETEGDSFLAFRQALTRAIDDYRGSQNQRFNDTDASQLYGDVIEPELAKLNVTFKTAQRKLFKSSGTKMLSWVGAIAFGLFSGFIPKQLEQAAQALGLTKILAELVEQTLGATQASEEVATNSMYFLWRVQKKARSDRRQRGFAVSPSA
jgi:hypothetical protein